MRHASRALNRSSDVVDLGPDYARRIAGLNLFIDLCVRGRKILPPLDPCSKALYLEEMIYLALEMDRRAATARGELYQPDLSEFRACRNYETYANYRGRLGIRPESGEPVPGPEPVKRGPVANLANLADEHSGEVAELLKLGLASLDGVFAARKLVLNRDGYVIDLGPDPAPGQAALQMLLNLTTRGRKPVEPPRGPTTRTYEELLPEFELWVEAELAYDESVARLFRLKKGNSGRTKTPTMGHMREINATSATRNPYSGTGRNENSITTTPASPAAASSRRSRRF